MRKIILIKGLRPMQTDATSHNIVGPNNVGSCWHLFSCWHLLRGACKRTQLLPTLLEGSYFGLNNSPFCSKLFLYLFIGPLTFFPQIIVFIWHVLEARVFLEKINQLVPPRDLTIMIFWCRIYSRFSILPKRLMFPQIICSTQLDTLCLQQSRKKRTRYDCLFFRR